MEPRGTSNTEAERLALWEHFVRGIIFFSFGSVNLLIYKYVHV